MDSAGEFYGLLLVCVGIIMMMLLMALLLLRKLQIEVREGMHKIAVLIEQQEKTPPAIVTGNRNSIRKSCPECEKEAKADDLICVYCHTKL
jgi:transposase